MLYGDVFFDANANCGFGPFRLRTDEPESYQGKRATMASTSCRSGSSATVYLKLVSLGKWCS